MTAPMWGVNGIMGGTAQAGTINAGGLYTAPAVIPMPLPVTIMAMANNQTAGASVDVQSKTVLVGGLRIVQSVAYLAGLDKLYTSELSFGASPGRARSPQGPTEQSTIFHVTTHDPPQSVAQFNDDIPKMISYAGVDGTEFLLLAGRSTGRILRLDPEAEADAVVKGQTASSSLEPGGVAGARGSEGLAGEARPQRRTKMK